MNRGARAAVAAFEAELEQLVAARAEEIFSDVVDELCRLRRRARRQRGEPPERIKRRREFRRVMKLERARPRPAKDDPFVKLAKDIMREPEPARALARAIDVDTFIEGRAGANELLEEALEKIRAKPPAPASFPTGSVVVIKKDGGGDLLARILEELPTGMVRVRRVDRYGNPIGKRTWMMVAGEVLRLADARPSPRGIVRYDVTDAGAGAAVVPDAVLPPGLRNIA